MSGDLNSPCTMDHVSSSGQTDKNISAGNQAIEGGGLLGPGRMAAVAESGDFCKKRTSKETRKVRTSNSPGEGTVKN